MGKETLDINKVHNTEDDFPEPLLGFRKKVSTWYPENTQIKYFVGNLSVDADRLEVESIMTKSLSCAGDVKKPGDIYVISEDGSFDRNANYNVVVKYLYLPE